MFDVQCIECIETHSNLFPSYTQVNANKACANATLGTTAVIVPRYVKSVFMIHVGGTRGVPSSTDNTMNIHVRITLTVEFIRTCIFLFLCDVSIQGRVHV